jgi:CRISPR-associated protein Cas5t
MRVLKVVAEGPVTSFRYPHFMQQIHPTFPMPPPATIYGHVCSTLGEWFDPSGVQFAYHFTHEGKVRDIEHIILATAAVGTLPGTKTPKVLQGKINPFERELLFRPRLVLYLNRPEWEPAFRSPRYAVVLGRSQDLFTYTSVTTLTADLANEAYFEHTLATHEMALWTMQGVTVLLPRYLDYQRQRAPTFSRYLILRDRVFSTKFYSFGGDRRGPYWIDPTSPEIDGLHMGLAWHSFVGEDGDHFAMA